MAAFTYEPVFQIEHDETPYRSLGSDGVSAVEFHGRTLLKVEPQALKQLAKQAFIDIAFYFRPNHLRQLRDELDDPEASDNDRFVLYTQLQNAVVSSAGKLPMCQDTGT